MSGPHSGRVLLLHLTVVGLLAGLQVLLPPFHHGMLARIMVLAAYAIGYNVLLGYAGLMSLVTGTTWVCPAYRVLGLSTAARSQ